MMSPIRNEPVTLMTSVPSGKRLPKRVMMAVPARYRASEPVPPPRSMSRYFMGDRVSPKRSRNRRRCRSRRGLRESAAGQCRVAPRSPPLPRPWRSGWRLRAGDTCGWPRTSTRLHGTRETLGGTSQEADQDNRHLRGVKRRHFEMAGGDRTTRSKTRAAWRACLVDERALARAGGADMVRKGSTASAKIDGQVKAAEEVQPKEAIDA